MIPQRYSLDSFLNAVRNPRELYDEFFRIFAQMRFQRKYGSGIDVMSQDWDYLFILDACRYDVFEETSWIDGELDSIISKGSHSEEFCNATFAGKTFYDTVYVTANAFGARIGEGVFHDLVYTGQEIKEEYVGWHSIAERMTGETVYNTALDAIRDYPNKRVIVHFMQPHTPYFGEKAQEIRDRVEEEGLIVRSRQPEKVEKYSLDEENVVVSLTEAAERGYVTESELMEVYVENLELVLEYVEKLVSQVNGKVVVTADHGEYLGEGGKMGHPPYEYSEISRKVPWLVIDSDDRPEITEEEPTNHTKISSEKVEKQLINLGYKE